MAIRTYDFIFGAKTTNYHTQSMFKDRVTQEELATPLDLLKHLNTEIGLMRSQSTLDLSPDAEVVLSNIVTTLNKIIEKGPGDNTEELANLREYFSTLSYTGYNIFLFERQDLDTDADFASITGYCYYADSDIVSNMINISEAWGIGIENDDKADLSSVVMSFIGSTIRFNSVTSDIIGFTKAVDQFNSLKRINSGYMFDASQLVEFSERIGYRFQIVY